MSAVLEEIVEKIHALPFVERQRLREILDSEAEDLEKERERRGKLSKKVMGKYAHLNTSSEDFARRKQDEIEPEDRRIKNL